GLARYGDTRAAAAILSGLLDACRALEHDRLPELLCGFDREPGEPPTLYHTACSPQAWASGAVFLLIQSVLGLAIDAATGCARFARPTLPDACDWIAIRGLEVRKGSVDLRLERSGDETVLRVLRGCEDVDARIADPPVSPG
ncbi:MAG TPA: amylo-alpha-1,6-glucosidase, partial [Myxococcota bacterium]|nr:amylo-alpha-1,6-glucosidase [Myxococcota bacterium]